MMSKKAGKQRVYKMTADFPSSYMNLPADLLSRLWPHGGPKFPNPHAFGAYAYDVRWCEWRRITGRQASSLCGHLAVYDLEFRSRQRVTCHVDSTRVTLRTSYNARNDTLW